MLALVFILRPGMIRPFELPGRTMAIFLAPNQAQPCPDLSPAISGCSVSQQVSWISSHTVQLTGLDRKHDRANTVTFTEKSHYHFLSYTIALRNFGRKRMGLLLLTLCTK